MNNLANDASLTPQTSLDEEKGERQHIEIAPANPVVEDINDSSPPMTLTADQERKLYRKIDIWLMPILSLMYLSAFLDRGAHIILLRVGLMPRSYQRVHDR